MILKEKRFDSKNRRLIKELYVRRKAAIKINERLTSWIELGRAKRQICRQFFLTFMLMTCLLLFWRKKKK